MQFNRLRLNGFKSFTDPTDLVIYPGLTGVVGPNGCGKSNLLEALRWIMGENRPTAMRGAGMEDVIFAGTDTRNARHFAEVSLQIDNRDRTAPAGFNDADTLDITRRITRDAGSAYKINGKEVRARDVQMLFADASTGAHSPALVRQGQISELINAKPKARRRILEEAAGISGLYQRRHEAELRLRATETNLGRVGDVIDQLAQQLAQLGRQARQAERYREIGTRLRAAEGAALYRRWQEAEALRAEAEGASRAALLASAQTTRAAEEARAAREGIEAALPAAREEDAIAAALLQRLEVQRDTLAREEERAAESLRKLEGRIAQLAHDITREAELNRDAEEMVAQLEWERDQIARAREGEEERQAELDALTAEAETTLAEIDAALTEASEAFAALSARHQTTARRRADLATARTRLESAEADALRAQETAEAELETLAASLDAARDEHEAMAALTEEAEESLASLEEARLEAQEAEAEARNALAESEGATRSLRAELGALDKLLAREAGDGGVLDAIEVAPGYEQALGAALSEDLRAPLAETGTGWRALPAYDSPPALPAGVTPLASHIRAPDALARRLGQIGLAGTDQAAALQASLRPGQRLVSPEGDLWRWDGLHLRAGDATSSAALRLAQMNQRKALAADLSAREAEGASLRDRHEALKARLADLTGAETQAREARRSADQRLMTASREMTRVESAQAQALNRLEALGARSAQLAAEADALRDQQEALEAEAQDLPSLDTERATIDALRLQVEGARIAMMSRRAQADEARRDARARLARAQEVTKSLSGWQLRLESAETRIEDLTRRKESAEEELDAAHAAPEEVAEQRARLADEIATASARATTARDQLLAAESALRAANEAERAAERAASDAREARAGAEVRLESAREAALQASARIHEEMGVSPAKLLDQLGADPETLPASDVLEAEITRLKRAREALGAVNLRAEEDARAVQSEYDLLTQERADLEAAIAKLRSGISALNREGRERLLIAFDKVNANFTTLFTHLFTGGEARLVLVESDDPLDAGLEIMCQPPGKKLSTLSLLSGGEQTLTALALIFAVFLANPAPICVLDEVDAPLDDANVARFCDLLDEMTRRAETRYLIITHNALTMARMDRLFGVTMAERGVSQLVSVDLREAETLVA